MKLANNRNRKKVIRIKGKDRNGRINRFGKMVLAGINL
ncbi:MAG: hypothetical protein K0Q87_220 [Neobacillus sp.]|jgi:hypothetical protein|nr:hypothetical protein [Neobacillus sp.]